MTVLGVSIPGAIADRSETYAWWDTMTDVVSLVDKHFLREPDREAMQQAAIEGMLESLNDPYTVYIPPAAERDFDRDIRGTYVGIGAEVIGEGGFLRIVSPLDDSPAYEAGIEADDVVVAVNGTSVFNLSADEIIDQLLGTPNTAVVLTIEREGGADVHPQGAKAASIPGAIDDAPGPRAGHSRFDLEIVRRPIKAATIKGLHREGDMWQYFVDPVRKIAYIRVTQFTETTVPALADATRRLLADGMTGLILDLRFNTGGSLDAAIGMSDLFLREGGIVSTKGRSGPEQKAIAREEGTLPDFPMVVLVNSGSASASEIVAGALADNNRAVILGERSFGKGSVQSVLRLPSGKGQLKITEQYYYLPSGRLLHREDDSTVWGVDPTPGFYVPMTAAENREMWRVRRDEEVLRSGRKASGDAGNWSDPQWILDRLKDPQLAAAVAAIGGKIDTGAWTPTGQTVTADTYENVALQEVERRQRLLIRELERTQARIDALAGGEPTETRDLLPDDVDLTDGTLVVRDADGNVIATLKITDGSLERWLIDAPVEPTAAAPEPKS
jgi:carboxyl-terminal processing protease